MPQPDLPEISGLKTCSIKISINLDKFSKSFSPPVLRALEESGMQKFEKELKFFIPNNFRTLEEEADSGEKIATLCSELEEWCRDYFGHLLAPGTKEQLVQHGVAIIFWLCPFHPVDSLEFKILCILILLAGIGDDWMDSAGSTSGQNVVEFVKLLSKMDQTGEDNNGEVQDPLTKSTKGSTMDLMRREPIIAALYDAITYLEESFMEIEEKRSSNQNAKVPTNLFAHFKKALVRGFQPFEWRHDQTKRNVVDDYSIETCRYFRQKEGILETFLPMMGLMEDLELSPKITEHSIFMKWRDLASKMDAVQNDILGLEKNLLGGEEDGILLQKIRRGSSLREVLDEEFNHFVEWTSDYVNLRRMLLAKFKDAKFARYVDFVDAILFGHFPVYIGSKKYGLKKGQVEIIHD